VISGFLITFVLNERREYRNLGNFYASRYLRLWPPYILVALASLILLRWDLTFTRLPASASFASMVFIDFSNLTLLFQDWIMFLRFDQGRLAFTQAFGLEQPPIPVQFLMVPQCWTLGVELTFYAIAPFVCRSWRRVALLLAFGLTVRLALGRMGLTGDPWLYRFAPAEMMLFAAGGLSYFAGRTVLPRFPVATKIAGLACVAAFVALTFGGGWVYPWLSVNSTIVLTYPTVLAFAAIAAAPLFYATRQWWLDRILGEMSYPIYIVHTLVSNSIHRYAPEWMTDTTYLFTVLGLSAAMVYGVILPLDRFRRRFGGRESDNPHKVAGVAPGLPYAQTANDRRGVIGKRR
jgi:peptidoglycan/LPS O-acetylase OafA/YrhL